MNENFIKNKLTNIEDISKDLKTYLDEMIQLKTSLQNISDDVKSVVVVHKGLNFICTYNGLIGRMSGNNYIILSPVDGELLAKQNTVTFKTTMPWEVMPYKDYLNWKLEKVTKLIRLGVSNIGFCLNDLSENIGI